MKKALLYLLLFSYSTIILKPIFPSIADVIAHIFWYNEHVATVHFEHGNYHIHYDYQEASKKYPDKNTPSYKNERSAGEHLISNTQFSFSIQPRVQNMYGVISSGLFSTHISNDYPPPKL